jgi:hypothetical protein
MLKLFFHCRKQVEFTGSLIRRIEWLWHAAHAMFLAPLSWCPTRLNWAIVEMNDKSFLIRRPSLRKDRFFERSKYICDKVGVVHFGIIWKSIDNIEPSRIPYNRKQIPFALNLLSRFCGHIISRQSPHPTWWCIKENPGLVTGHEMLSIIILSCTQIWQHRRCLLFSFCSQIICQQAWDPMEMKGFESYRLV